MVLLAPARACPLVLGIVVLACGEVVAQPIVEAELGQAGTGAHSGQGGLGSGGGAGLAGAAGAGPGGTGGALVACGSTASWPPAWEAFEIEAARLIAEARTNGASCAGSTSGPLAGLAQNTALLCAARSHAGDMAERGYFSLGTWDETAALCSSDGECAEGQTCDARWPNEGTTRCLASASSWVNEAGYSGTFLGQAIAMGQSSPASVVESWLGSSDTCELLMSTRADAFGVGYAESEAGEHFWTLILGG